MRWVCAVSLVLWVALVGSAAWLFVRGVTAPGTDGRTAIRLAPAERDVILGEMRALLVAVDGVVNALSDGTASARQSRVKEAARAAGMGMAADVEPGLMAKLPLPFKQMGLSVHRDFDEMAERAERGADPSEVLRALSSITNRCTACHAMYQLVAERP